MPQIGVAAFQFYRVDSWTPDMIVKLGTDQASNTIVDRHLKASLNPKNPWRQRCVRDHPNFSTVIAEQAKLVDSEIEIQ